MKPMMFCFVIPSVGVTPILSPFLRNGRSTIRGCTVNLFVMELPNQTEVITYTYLLLMVCHLPPVSAPPFQKPAGSF